MRNEGDGAIRALTAAAHWRQRDAARVAVAAVRAAVRANLTGGAAKALNAAFDVDLFTKGLTVGTASVRAVPA